MFSGTKLHDWPGRLATGAYILNAGIGKRGMPAEHAAGLHGSAVGAYAFLKDMPPETFVRRLSTAEITVGTLLLAPIVPTLVAGAALTAFAGGLVTMYVRTPALREPHSLRPSQQGSAIAKDSWMLGMGLGFMIDALGRRCRRKG